jgi:hypothetical protein
MDNFEAQTFVVSEVQARFPDTTWTGALTSDWEYALKNIDRQAALSAIRTLQAESKVKKPALGKFVKMAWILCASRSPTRTDYFIQYRGGGKTTLNAGYFFQIITTEEDHCAVAHSERSAWKHSYGGEWRVITDTSWSEMIADRKVLSLQAKE